MTVSVELLVVTEGNYCVICATQYIYWLYVHARASKMCAIKVG